MGSIGWRDRFGGRSFDRRQRAYARRPGLGDVYTPQLIVNGQRTQAATRGLDRHLAELRKAPAPVRLRIDLAWQARGRRLEARVAASPRDGIELPGEPLQLLAALFERHLETRVARGENRNRTLRHDFVVRRLLTPQDLVDGEAVLAWDGSLPRSWKAADTGLAAWVQGARTRRVYQASAITIGESRRPDAVP